MLGVSWCSGHCAVGGALVAAAAGTAAVAGHRPFQQSEARSRSWAVGVELLASDGLPIAWPVGSMERAWAVSAWSSDGTSLVCCGKDSPWIGLLVGQFRSSYEKGPKLPMHVSSRRKSPGSGVSVSARHTPASPGEACAGRGRSHTAQAPVRGCRVCVVLTLHRQPIHSRRCVEYSGKLHHLSGVALLARASIHAKVQVYTEYMPRRSAHTQ